MVDAAEDYKPLFLDELRSRSIKRIDEDPLFHDLSAEIHLIKQKSATNSLSLNEEVRRDELAEETSLRDKADSDRIIAGAHDRAKYYRLMLDGVDKLELKPTDKKAEPGTTWKRAVPDEIAITSNSALPGESDFGTATENDALTRETLNILSDLVTSLSELRSWRQQPENDREPGRVRLRPHRGLPRRLACDITPINKSFDSLTVCTALDIVRRKCATLLIPKLFQRTVQSKLRPTPK